MTQHIIVFSSVFQLKIKNVDETGSIIYENDIFNIKGTEIVMKKLVESLPDWIAKEVTCC